MVSPWVCLAGVLLFVANVTSKDYKEMTDDELYVYIFDDVDVDYIIYNDRICTIYLKCFYSTGRCSNLASAIKSKMTEVFATVCGSCTDKQKKIWRHILAIFIPRRPKDWEKLLEIYDPEGKYWPGIKNFIDTNPPPEWPLKD